MRRFLLLSVLLVAPSASLAGPLPDTGSTTTASPSSTTTVAPSTSDGVGVSTTIVPQSVQAGQHHPVVIPWGQGVAVGGDQLPAGGFIYCAGCSPINPGQVVIPTNVPYNLPSASGVIPPPAAVRQIQHNEPLYTIEQQLNGLGGGGNSVGGGLQEPGKGQNIWDDGSVPVQQMALHDDGRYSFAYSTAHSSRQEERNLEGNVAGSYSYTDPEGKLVQIDYTAGPQGYQAYGDNVPPQPVLQVPQPVQDTLEVQMARQQFLDTYNRELERIHRDREEAAARAATASPVAPAGLEDNDGAASQVDDEAAHGDETEGGDDALVISGKTEDGAHDGVTTDELADSVVIDAQGGDAHQQDDDPVQPIDVRTNLPDPSYQITIPIGVGGNQGNQGLSVQQAGGRVQEEAGNNNWIGQGQQVQQQSPQPVIVQQQPVQQIAGAKSNIQPYFYYVSVGGQPHYVTSSSGQAGYNSPYPTSLKATLLGAQPLAAVHDVQVPNRGGNAQQQQQLQQSTAGANYNRPVYLDLENSLKLDQSQGTQQAGQAVTVINPASLFSVANNQNNPVLGQLVPLSLSPGNTATIGYIPAIILNNNGQIVQQSSLQGSQQQQFNVPLIQQQQQQQVPSAVPSLNNNDHQSVIVSASK